MLAPRDIPDLHFPVAEREDKGDLPEKTDMIELMNVNIKDCVKVPRNSDFREHSRNSLQGVAGEAQVRLRDERSLGKALDSELHSNISEYRKHSQKSQDSGKPTNVETPRELAKGTLITEMHLQHSECREHSQNSRIKQPGTVEVTAGTEDSEATAASSDFSKHSQDSLSKGEPKADPGEANVTSVDSDGQRLVTVSEFRELSRNSRVVKETTEGELQHISPVCVSEPSEYLRDSLGVGNNVSVPSFSWLKSMSQIVGLTATLQDKVEGNPTGANTAGNAKINTSPVHTKFNFFL